MPRQCVLFDFDGVIADTERRNADYLAAALAQHGVTLSAADRLARVGTNDRTALVELLARAPKPVGLEAFMAERRLLGNSYEDGTIQPMPGLVDFVRGLRAAGVKTGLVSSTSARLILAALDHMGMMALFDVILCGDMVERTKPDPTCYQKAMAFLGVAPSDCVVIEDSAVGIRAGRAAGAYVIAYRGAGIPQDTREANAAADTFAECAALLQGG